METAVGGVKEQCRTMEQVLSEQPGQNTSSVCRQSGMKHTDMPSRQSFAC